MIAKKTKGKGAGEETLEKSRLGGWDNRDYVRNER